ncbi:histone deacetylase complex subunit Sap18-like protein [Theileria orientalis]|uniref:Histone deacetylase complex subunit Sap18-like protein n=1 Tax=Theileria orientalis TaxID=68886 RepID=A0A976M550_THEOR|nr:histone deacetylase complex subunit Sap18-like protein [Theileria orientalis]
MRSSSESMSRSMSLSRTVSSDRSMSIEDDGAKARDKTSQPKSKFDSISTDNYRTNHRDKDLGRGRRRSASRSSTVSRSTSFSSVSYDKYKNYKNFKKSKYSRSSSRSRSYSRGRNHKKSYSYSSSYRSRSSSISSESVSSSSSRSTRPRRIRRREEVRRGPDRRGGRDYHNARDRPRTRATNRRDLGRKSIRGKQRQEDKRKFEEPRLNGRSRVTEKINGYARGANKENKREQKVDRKHNTPFLLKVMAPPTDSTDEEIASEELHVYVWLDSTLRDLVNLIKDISPPTRKHTSTWCFTTNKGKYLVKVTHNRGQNTRDNIDKN